MIGCGQKNNETVTVYPCYFNRDVEGMDAAFICKALEQAGWTHVSSDQDGAYENATTHIYELVTDGQKQGIVIYEFATAEQAEQVYVQDNVGTVFPALIFPDEHSLYSKYIRISNCLIMTMRNGHADLIRILELGSVEPLEVPTENSYELRRKIKSVDIETVKSTMEADGYAFYPIEFIGSEDDFLPTYVIISPEQDRAYVYTFAENKPLFGMPYTYYVYNLLERVALNYEGEDNYVGMHFVGFKDGSCVLCYGDSFEEIEGYFAN